MTIEFEKEKATQMDATFAGSTEAYALMWLRVTNNARENSFFYKIQNYSNNDISVVYDDKECDVAGWLENLGLEIKSKREVTVVCPYVEYSDDDSVADEEYGYVYSKVREC